MKSTSSAARHHTARLPSPRIPTIRDKRWRTQVCRLFALSLLVRPAQTSHFSPDEERYYFLPHDDWQAVDVGGTGRSRTSGLLDLAHLPTQQVIVVTVVLAALGFAYFFFVGRNERETLDRTPPWLSHIPAPFDKLAIYLHYEAVAYFAVLVDFIMSVVNTPLNLGLGLASRLSSGSLSAKAEGGRHRSYSETLRVGERGTRRGKKAGRLQKVGDALASTSATTSRDGPSASLHFPGIWNTGNSCFLNSTLQCLASVSTLQTLLEQIIQQAEQWDVPTPVTDALYDITLQLNTGSRSRTAIVPQKLTDALSDLPQSKVGSFFYAHQQQDAHELLVLITNALDEEVKAIEQEKQSVVHMESTGLRAIFMPPVSPSLSELSGKIYNPCRALVAQRTACLDCGYVEAVRHYPADELSLTVPPRSGSSTTIEACLLNWSRLEVVDWVCFRCSLIRTLESTRHEVSYLTTSVANVSSESGASASAKKKSGAKRRKLREAKEREHALTRMVSEAYGEDEGITHETLERHDIQLEKAFSRAATKQVMLARTPKVLMLHLNRSTYSASNFGASKNNASILFDDELDLADIVTGGDLSVRGDRPISRGATPMEARSHEDDAMSWSVKQNGKKGIAAVNGKSNGGANTHIAHNLTSVPQHDTRTKRDTRYRLSGIVVHYGGHSSGHYVAFRRRNRRTSGRRNDNVDRRGSSDVENLDDIDESDGEDETRAKHVYEALTAAYNDDESVQDEWYRISDDSVSRCSWHDVSMQNPFLLFYERLADTQEGNDGQAHSLSHVPSSRSEAHFKLPHSFEPFALSSIAASKGRAPRVIQRWEALPFDKPSMSGEDAGSLTNEKVANCNGSHRETNGHH